MSPKPLLYLIDGSSQMYRAYHAPIRTAEGTILRNAMGIPTNAVYIFVTMLRKLLKEHQPEFIAASFDLPGRTFRDDLASDYKANRKPMPDELAGQIPLVHRACEALGVPIITHQCLESHGLVASWDGDLQNLTVYASTQAVPLTAEQLAKHFNIPLTRVKRLAYRSSLTTASRPTT